jgi:hypothetical protein
MGRISGPFYCALVAINNSLSRKSKKEIITLLRRRYFCWLSGAVGENLFELRNDGNIN